MNVTLNLERFHARVDRSGGPDACWPWTGRIDPVHGYGVVSVKGASWYPELAHRVAYYLAKGDPRELCVLHTCDNRPCCNPTHLWPGTRGDNHRDMHAKGRNNQPRGEAAAPAILTDAQVLAARALYFTGSSTGDLALIFSVSAAALGEVVRGKYWKHLPGAHSKRWARAHLSHEDVLEVLRSAEPARVLASRLGTHPRNIRNCRAGRTYRNVAAEVLGG